VKRAASRTRGTERGAAPAVLGAVMVLLAAGGAHAQGAPAGASPPPPPPLPAAGQAPASAAPPVYAPPQYVPNPTAPYGDPAAGPPPGPMPQWGQPPGAPPGASPPAAGPERQRPRSLEEFKRLRADLKADLRDAQRDDRDADARRIRDDLEEVDDWYDEDTERRSGGAMAGGIVMISVGGLSFLIGGLTLLVEASFDTIGGGNDRAQAVGAIMTLGGLGMVGGGIPLMIYGSQRVMAADNALLTPGQVWPPAPRGAIVVGPGSLLLEGSF
jgi:hypothetical protein